MLFALGKPPITWCPCVIHILLDSSFMNNNNNNHINPINNNATYPYGTNSYQLGKQFNNNILQMFNMQYHIFLHNNILITDQGKISWKLCVIYSCNEYICDVSTAYFCINLKCLVLVHDTCGMTLLLCQAWHVSLYGIGRRLSIFSHASWLPIHSMRTPNADTLPSTQNSNPRIFLFTRLRSMTKCNI